MTTMTDYQGFVTTTGFDRLDRPATLRDPRNGLTAFRYDAAGNLTALVDAALNTTMFEYDRLDRRTANTNRLCGRRRATSHPSTRRATCGRGDAAAVRARWVRNGADLVAHLEQMRDVCES